MTRTIQIDGRTVGPGHPVYVIAEAGINHNGSLETAKRLVDAAKAAGADAVKFQLRHLDLCYSRAALDDPQAGEQGLQYLLPEIRKANLPWADMREVCDYCAGQGITFLCTPWDEGSADLLELTGMPAYKIGSPDLTNLPLIRHVAAKGKPLILSTGMATEEEIEQAVESLLVSSQFALLHCVSSYPAPLEDLNLRYIATMKDWGCPIGWSGHDWGAEGFCSSVAAVALGASIIERHLTLSREMEGPDHRASLEPAEFATMVAGVRNIERALGDGVKRMTRGELLNRRTLGKSLVAAHHLLDGVLIEKEMVTVRSPGLGLSPARETELVGRRLHRNMEEGEPFLESDLDPRCLECDGTGRVQHHGEWFAHGACEGTGRLLTNGSQPKINLPFRWGIVARFNDAAALAERFLPLGMSLIEYHVSDKDLDAGLRGFRHRPEWGEVVVHAPEVMGNRLMDFCSDESGYDSVRQLEKVYRLAAQLGDGLPSKPRVVFHVGGMTLEEGRPDPRRYERLRFWLDAFKDSSAYRWHCSEVDLLIENLPPYPWYFGGRWHGHVLTDPETVARVCRETGLGLCFDTSHAALWCNANGRDLNEYAHQVRPYVHHLHVSDARGVADEGLQIGDGTIDFAAVLSHPRTRIAATYCEELEPTLVPEVWMGHHDNGAGFLTALERLTELLAPAGKGVARGS